MSVRRFIKKLDVFAWMLLIALILTGCALGGTEAGNPNFTPLQNTNERIYFTEDILHVACIKLSECYPNLSPETCQFEMKTQSNLAPALGLGAGYATYQDAINAEKAGTITANIAIALTCENDIATLSCASAPALSAYSPASPAVFTNVVSLIPTSSTSCAGVF